MNYNPTETAQQCLLYRTSVGHVWADSRYEVHRKRFDSYLLMYVLEGELICRTETKEYSIQEGRAVLLNCYAPHAYFSPQSCEFYWTHFDGNGAAALFSQLSPEDNACVFSEQKAENIGQFLTLSFYNAPVVESTEEEYAAELYRLLVSLLDSKTERRNHTIRRSHDLITAVNHFIAEKYKYDIFIKDIARYVSVSESQLNKIYKRETSLTPHTVLIQYRIKAACKLLRSSSLSVSEIAEEVGYHSLSNFTYGFTRIIGMTPSEYRAMNSVVF